MGQDFWHGASAHFRHLFKLNVCNYCEGSLVATLDEASLCVALVTFSKLSRNLEIACIFLCVWGGGEDFFRNKYNFLTCIYKCLASIGRPRFSKLIRNIEII